MTFGKKVRFIDLFAGIGGFHHAALKVFPDAECVMAVEWDKDCQKVYSTMFPETDLRGDIREVLYATKSGKQREATAPPSGCKISTKRSHCATPCTSTSRAARTGRGATCRRGGSRGRGRGCVECAVLLDPCRSLGEQGLHRRLARRRRGGAGARLDVERDVAQVRTFAQCGPIPATATNTVSSRPRSSPITQEPASDSTTLSYRARAPRVDSAA